MFHGVLPEVHCPELQTSLRGQSLRTTARGLQGVRRTGMCGRINAFLSVQEGHDFPSEWERTWEISFHSTLNLAVLVSPHLMKNHIFLPILRVFHLSRRKERIFPLFGRTQYSFKLLTQQWRVEIIRFSLHFPRRNAKLKSVKFQRLKEKRPFEIDLNEIRKEYLNSEEDKLKGKQEGTA